MLPGRGEVKGRQAVAEFPPKGGIGNMELNGDMPPQNASEVSI